PLVWLEEEGNADFLSAQNLMRITMSGHTSGDLVALVSAVRDSYKSNILDKERENRQTYLKKLTELHADQQEKLNKKRTELGPLAQDAGGNDPTVRSLVQAFLQRELSELERELIQVRSELIRCKTDLDV